MKDSVSTIQNSPISARPWYKEPCLWLVLAPLITVVIVSSLMVTIAVKGADDVVKDNYYREGRMINHDDSPEITARAKHIESDMEFNWQTGNISVRLTHTDAVNNLTLNLIHPAQAEHDLQIDLQQAEPGTYRAKLEKPSFDRWTVRLAAHNTDEAKTEIWRLNGKVDFSQSTRVHLE